MEINWNKPIKIKQGWKREWEIPSTLLNGFFQFWKNNKFKLLVDGFSVYKNKSTDTWYLTETKINQSLFKKFGENTNNNKELVKYDDDDFILNPVEVINKEGLREWQVDSVGRLVAAINKWGSGVDGSSMGIGKSFQAIGTIRELNANFAIVCPKAVIHQWTDIVKNHFKISDKCYGIINYESLIRGKTESEIASYIKKRSTHRNEFTWKIPKNSIIIWDEAHKLKNWKTQNSKTCIAALKQGYRHLFLSASLACTPLELRTIGTCLRLFRTSKEYYEFLYNNGCTKGQWGMVFNNDKDVLNKLHIRLFQKRGVRLKRDEIANFPECEIQTEPYTIDEKDTKEINEIYEEMHKELKKLENTIKQDKKDNELTIRLRSRQKVELLKIGLIQSMVEESIEAGMSVIVFLNFSDSIDALANRLNTKCIFDGRVGEKIREINKENFQNNTEKVIIINTAAGGAGLSLGDLMGDHPRISIVSPDDSPYKIYQCSGRSTRENSKSKSIVKYVYIANTIEEVVANNVKQKINNLELLNDGDVKI